MGKTNRNEIRSAKKIFEFDNKTKVSTIEKSQVFNFDKFQKFTISLWVKFYGIQNGSVLAKMNDDESDFFRGWDLRFYPEDEKQIILFQLIDTYPTNCLIHTTQPIDQIGDYQWHHLVITHNGFAEAGSIRIFIDGKLQSTYAKRASLEGEISNNYPITIGARTNDSNHFDGKVFGVHIIKDELDENEVLQLALDTKPKEENDDIKKNLKLLEKKQVLVKVKNLTRIFRVYQEKEVDIFYKLKSLVSRKAGYKGLTVLDNISFELRKGEVLGILGRNGSGKTTLLKIIGKIMKPTSGVVEVNGTVSSFLYLGSGFHPDLTAKQNIVLYGTILGENKKSMKRKTDDVIKFAELEEFADSRIKDFSTGMLMRLAISTALCVDPDVLLVDEVLSVGDYSFQQKSSQAFQKLKERGKSIIFVSHNFRQLEQFCDRVILLENGKIVKSGKPEQVIENYIELMNGTKN